MSNPPTLIPTKMRQTPREGTARVLVPPDYESGGIDVEGRPSSILGGQFRSDRYDRAILQL